MLGDAGVGKTALTHQFTTSDYICAYDLSLGKKNQIFSLQTRKYDNILHVFVLSEHFR